MIFVGKKNTSGFTIVELLIVIVVIGILAAITIVAFNGVQNKAKTSAAQSTASQATRKLAIYAVTASDTYPADKASLLTSTGLQEANGVVYQYSPASDLRSYCLTTTTNNVSFYATHTVTTPLLGGCPGHGVGGNAPITNLVTNPSVETNTTGWSLSVNSSVASRDATSALVGAYGINVTAPATGIDSGVSIPTGATLTAGTTYTASFMLKALTAGPYSLSVQGVAGTGARDTRTVAAGQTARFYLTWTPTSSGGFVFYALRQGSGSSGAHAFYIDGAMLVQGSTNENYADGTSSNWIWNGSAHASTSAGPSL